MFKKIRNYFKGLIDDIHKVSSITSNTNNNSKKKNTGYYFRKKPSKQPDIADDLMMYEIVRRTL